MPLYKPSGYVNDRTGRKQAKAKKAKAAKVKAKGNTKPNRAYALKAANQAAKKAVQRGSTKTRRK